MTRAIIALAAAFVVAGGAAVYALAGHQPGSVASITGCLTSTGKLVKLKVGDVPKQPCAGQTEVHMSGGDITAVLPGFGLAPRSGATQGSATLAVDPTVIQNRVTKTCGPDDAITQIHEDGSVDCDDDGVFRNYAVVTKLSNLDSSSPKSLPVSCPAGTRVLGGGGSVTSRFPALLVASQPVPGDPDSWVVAAREEPPTGDDWGLAGFAICADVD